MSADSQITTVLTLHVSSSPIPPIRRRMELRGEAALEVARILTEASSRGLTVMAEEPPATLREVVESDVGEVLAGIPPLCPICEGELTAPHHNCEKRALAYLALA